MKSLIEMLSDANDDLPLGELQAVVNEGMLDGLSRDTLSILSARVLSEVSNDPTMTYAQLLKAARLHAAFVRCVHDSFAQSN